MPRSSVNILPASRARRSAGVTFAGVTAALLLTQIGALTAASAATKTVGLGTAGSYAVLGGQTVTNTGPSKLNADLGVNPGSAITGFPPGKVHGATHAGDASAAQAQSDLVIAYNDAAGRAPTAAVAGDLVGTTKTAGVYKSTGPLALSGTLTLDGQGDPGAVFIFQVASTLITASASHVSLVNSAQACHVFWQVGSSATLGTASTFAGTIMALTSVSVTTATTVHGRALARNGAVTLDDNTFTDPSCATTPAPVPTKTSVTVTPDTATTGATVTLDAAVTSPAKVTTGTVTFTENGTTLGTVALGSTGHATLTIPAGDTAGTRRISAHYNGHGTLTTSTSPTAELVVRSATPPTSTTNAPTSTHPTATATSTRTRSVVTTPSTTSRATRSTAVADTIGTTSRHATATTTARASTTTALASTGAAHVGTLLAASLAMLGVGAATIALTTRRRGAHRRH